MSEHFEYLVRAGDPELVVARARLARRQAELLSALVAGGPVPEGFDQERIRVQSQVLLAKRRDTVARVAPEVARLLGDQYQPLFRRYAQQGPALGGHRADARAFAEWAVDWAAVGVPNSPWRPALERWLRPAEPPRRRWRRFHG